jgi:hypothetical protein
MNRRAFLLPEEDLAFLDNLVLSWETIIDGGMQWVIIHDYPLPHGYLQKTIGIAIKIETGYPRTALDMAYFYPPLERIDHITINAVSPQQIDGKQYQRWSRHRTTNNPWREGIDDLSTHIAMVDFWFLHEFIKHPCAITT